MKARIWMDREDGLWRFAVRNTAGNVFWTGSRPKWEEVLLLLLPELEPERM